jgi:hypothetical protein
MFRSLAKSLLALFLVFLSSYTLEVTLHRDGVPGRDLLLASSLLVGTVAGVLVYVLSLRERQHQAYVECRLRVIADMNHHIRNALQVITFYSRTGAKQQVGIVEAVERIQWALREVLPQLPESLQSESTADNQSPMVQPRPSIKDPKAAAKNDHPKALSPFLYPRPQADARN